MPSPGSSSSGPENLSATLIHSFKLDVKDWKRTCTYFIMLIAKNDKQNSKSAAEKNATTHKKYGTEKSWCMAHLEPTI